MSSPALLNELQKLNTVGSVLYVAAHPDDENTTLLTYLAQEERLETAYLSLTRGGGGQNLIGPELKEALGLIRANELLQARRIDGARQLFTRARDFGYSKGPEDTLENWQEEKVLGDVVYAVRYFQPDVIITRFNPHAGGTHGHHTVSAQLALKAFRLAADPSQFPEQLDHLDIHQAKRIFWNGYSWRGAGNLENETRQVVSLDIGKYHPLLGASYTEIAARSRSMHKSQGFGRAGSRGEQRENLVLLDGAPADGGLFSGIDTSWARYPGGEKAGRILGEAIREYDHQAPWKSVPKLIEADQAIDSLPLNRHIRAKRESLHRLIAATLGLHFEARSETAYLTPGDPVDLEVELTLRAPVPVTVRQMEATLFDGDRWPEAISLHRMDGLNTPLVENRPSTTRLRFRLPENAPVTQPFWLRETPDTGIYHFKNTRLLELMTIPPAMAVTAQLEIDGYPVELTTPAVEVVSDPVKGEVRHRVNLRPKIVLEPDAGVLLFENKQAKTVDVTVTGNAANVSGTLQAEAPDDWSVLIAEPRISLPEAGSVIARTVVITPPKNASEGSVIFKVVSETGNTYDLRANRIEYEHVGRLSLLAKAETKLTRLDLKRGGTHIACIVGVGDPVPETLLRIGYAVDLLEVEDISREMLKAYDSVILGPRAFDALPGLDKKFDELTAYVNDGGTLVCQFNTTSSRGKSEFRAPFPLRLSRERVSEEKAEMRMLLPDHRVFNIPNKIVPRDFEDWIQERGLYFADSWDEKYDVVISSNDREEPPRNGGLLIARYGKGWYAYTGLSFFRQLPEGHSGAIKLFVNLISLGHGN